MTTPILKEETFGRDLSDWLHARLSFDESINDASLAIMTRQRLKKQRGKMGETRQNPPQAFQKKHN